MAQRFSPYIRAVFCLLAALLVGCASAPRPIPSSNSIQNVPLEPNSAVGVASFYGQKYQGRRTASGEIYDMRKMTAAHRSLPFGANVRVTNLSNNRTVIVRINDRGPFTRERIIDLSLAAARQLGIVQNGTARVKIELLADPADRARLEIP